MGGNGEDRNMKLIEEKLACALLQPDIINDNRGWFQVAFNIDDIHNLGLDFSGVCQLNHSWTEEKGVVRGPNYQKAPYNQVKVVRVTRGAVYSVGIDINPESSTFGKAVGFLLSEKNKFLMYIPNTYAHGFTVLEDNTELEYLTDNKYNYESAKSIWFDDEEIIDIDTMKKLDWSFNGAVILNNIKSEKNLNAPRLRDADL